MKNNSISIPGLLFLLLVGLKLTGHIDWSWWWVTALLWVPIGTAILVMAFVGLVSMGGRGKRGG